MNKRYLETTKANGAKKTMIRIDVSYSKGGANMFSGNQERRGYSLHVLPVEVEEYEGGGRSEAFALFGNKGLRAFLLEVKRQSPKAEAEALKLAAEKEPEVLAMVLAKSGLTLAGPAGWIAEPVKVETAQAAPGWREWSGNDKDPIEQEVA